MIPKSNEKFYKITVACPITLYYDIEMPDCEANAYGLNSIEEVLEDIMKHKKVIAYDIYQRNESIIKKEIEKNLMIKDFKHEQIEHEFHF